jgi:hypothetical protein
MIELNYKGKKYSSRFNLPKAFSTLYLDNFAIGKSKSVKSSLTKYEHEIKCENTNDCFVHSIIDIMTDTFN